jgi:hypothetical protein
MTLEDLQAQGRLIPDEGVDRAMAILAVDPRFPAFLKILEQHRAGMLAVLTSPQTAAMPTSATVMAHAAGGIGAILELELRLAAILSDREKV